MGHSYADIIRRAFQRDMSVNAVLPAPDNQVCLAVVCRQVFQSNLLARFEPLAWDALQERDSILLLQGEHPPALHKEPPLLVGLVAADLEVVFPEGVALAVLH